jgi:hypothetical protein
MTLSFTPEESEGLFYDALCNAVGTGYIDSYGLEMIARNEDYNTATKSLKPLGSPAYEDVLMQVLRQGGELTLVDHESEGEYTRSITLADVHTRLNECLADGSLEPATAWRSYWEEGDAADADAIIQAVFYKEIIFG